MQVKLLTAFLALTAFPAFAQSDEPVRYQLISVSGGFVRLDTVSGVMTFCRDEVDSFRCSPISADASADMRSDKGEVKRDQNGVKRDQDGVTRDSEQKQGMIERDRQGDRDTARRDRGFREDSSSEDFDRALTMMEKAMRSFMAITRESPRECAL